MKRILLAPFILFLLMLVPFFALADETISSGLTLVIPSQGATNWGTTFKNSFATPISAHDHTGGGKGLQLGTNAFSSNAITGVKIRLANDQYLRGRNQLDNADLNALKFDTSNILRFDSANVGANTRADLGLAIGTNVQAYDADLLALAGVTSAADKLPYFTGSGAATVTTFTSFGRSLVDDADAAAAQTTLSLVPGTNVQAFDAELAALAGLSSAADRLPYFTGSGTASLATFTAAGRALVDDADATAQKVTLGLVIGTNVQAQDGELSALAGLTSAADKLPYFTGSGTAANADFTAAGRALVDDADATAQRNTLSLGTANSPTFTGVNLSGLTASRAVETDGSKNLVTNTDATFKSNHTIASSGTNTDITAVNGIARNTYTPGMSGSGSMTTTSIVRRNTDYARVGPFVFVHLIMEFTVGGTPSTIVSIDAPISGVASDSGAAFACAAEQGSTSYGVGNTDPGKQQCRWRYVGGTTNGIAVFLTGAQNWSAGSTTIHINGFYLAV